MEDVFQIRLVQVPLSNDEILNSHVNYPRLKQLIRKEKCDAVIAPLTLQDALKDLTIPVYRATFCPLAAEEIRLTLDHVAQILDIWQHQQTLNARTEMMLKQSFDAIFCLDDQGRIKLWNTYAETLFHLTKKEILNERLWELLPLPDPQLLEDSDQAARIRRALEQSKGKRKDAAELLGIHPSTLWRQMKALGIS